MPTAISFRDALGNEVPVTPSNPLPVLNPGTFDYLAQIAGIIGGGQIWGLWPFLESVGSSVRAYGYQVLSDLDLTSRDEAAARTLEAEWSPYRHSGGVHSYYNVAATNNHLSGPNLSGLSIGTVGGVDDQAWSFGIWLLGHSANLGDMSLISKYRTSAPAAREYDLRINAAGSLELELYDETADASEIATGVEQIYPDKWYFCVAAYDGNQASPIVQLSLNGVADGDGSTIETGAYVAGQITSTPLLLGARNLTTAPAQEFEGRLALPLFTEKMLTASQVASIYTAGRRLLGLA